MPITTKTARNGLSWRLLGAVTVLLSFLLILVSFPLTLVGAATFCEHGEANHCWGSAAVINGIALFIGGVVSIAFVAARASARLRIAAISIGIALLATIVLVRIGFVLLAEAKSEPQGHFKALDVNVTENLYVVFPLCCLVPNFAALACLWLFLGKSQPRLNRLQNDKAEPVPAAFCRTQQSDLFED